jgi:septal ring factor EnvC (AmiA/AmiB activator)
VLAAGLCTLALVAGSRPASAQVTQQDLRASQTRLDSIKHVREQLQRELSGLQTQVRDASRELVNIGRQRAASVGALQEIEFQAAVLQTSFEQTNAALEEARTRYDSRTAALHSRLRSIYKRGPLHTVRVIMTAENFGDLLNRYKYLQLMSLHDRTALNDVRRLQTELSSNESELRETYQQIENLLQEKSREAAALRRLEQQGRRALDQVRSAEASTSSRIQQAERDEAQLVGIIGRLESERLAAERRRANDGAAAAPGTITTTDLGGLSWPVEGRITYRFGPERKSNGNTLMNNGIGIAAPAGTRVRAVQAGTVEHAGPFAGYGSMVMVNHGAGFYTLYMYLKTVSVQRGQTIGNQAEIGTVGGEQTPEGAHIEFQVRRPVNGTTQPVDPLTWLRSRSGG